MMPFNRLYWLRNDKDFTGKDYCLDNEIELVYNNRKHRFSTTELRKRMTLSR